jgi:hypothetical protein
MKRIKEGKLKYFPFKLNYEKCLIYYDGPILELYTTEQKEYYLSFWVDYNYKLNRWLYFKVSFNDYFLYDEKLFDLYEIIKKSTDNYIVDIDVKGNFNRVYTIKYQDIPIDYIPEKKPF